MGPPTDPGPSGSARASKWSVHPCCYLYKVISKMISLLANLDRSQLTYQHVFGVWEETHASTGRT
ncbi:unnamed protein product, partial [Staurois parvus]